MSNHELNFLELLQGFRRGDLVQRADAELNELMQAIRENGGKGELTLKMPFKVNDAGQIECVPTLTVKKPQRPMGTGIFFVTDEGRLSRRDPAQMDLIDELEERRSRRADLD